jgi:hypothetical protein
MLYQITVNIQTKPMRNREKGGLVVLNIKKVQEPMTD